jgi:hypothetical protein
MSNKENFVEWMNDGNVIQFSDGYATQDAQYRNRFKTLRVLYKYFLKEFVYI